MKHCNFFIIKLNLKLFLVKFKYSLAIFIEINKNNFLKIINVFIISFHKIS